MEKPSALQYTTLTGDSKLPAARPRLRPRGNLDRTFRYFSIILSIYSQGNKFGQIVSITENSVVWSFK